MATHVFILGAGRSGTKILRDCIGSATDVAAIPYDVGYVWTYNNHAVGHDELLVEHLSPRISSYVQKSLDNMGKRVAKGEDFNVLLEKSVPNTLRPAFMHSIFPNARFIHLVRDGRDVVESAMRNWESPSDTGYFLDKLRYFPWRNAPYALWYLSNRLRKLRRSNDVPTWGPRYDGVQEDANTLPLIEVCSNQWLRCVKTCHEQLAQLPSDQVFELRYEDFVNDRSSIDKICDFAGVTDIDSVRTFYDTKIQSNKIAESRSKLSDKELHTISSITSEMLATYGYDTGMS